MDHSNSNTSLNESESCLNVEMTDSVSQNGLNETVDINITNDPNCRPPEVDYDSIGEFCFESEQLALKGNADYKNILQALVVLEAQRVRAVEDLHQLKKMKQEALNAPFEFVEKLKQSLKFPLPQKLHPLPVIDWGKYAVHEDSASFAIRIKKELATASALNKIRRKRLKETSSDSERLKDTSMWSMSEQDHLKELLAIIPPEEPETHRWEKIAKRLGSRTPFEVASQVHKYYGLLSEDVSYNVQKLPDLIFLRKFWNLDRTAEADEDQNAISVKPSEEISDEENIDPELHDTPEYQELMLLKKVLREKLSRTSTKSEACECKGCHMRKESTEEPVFKKRCLGVQYNKTLRSSTAVHQSTSSNKGFMDSDYLSLPGSGSSYLDPNYLPAS